MKQFVCLISGCWMTVICFAQSTSLQVTINKTTSLLFPYSIRHVDIGSRNVLVQQVAEADHILLIKAASKDFEETNLSVVTSDGNLYSFPVSYAPVPSSLVYNIPAQSGVSPESYAKGIMDNERSVFGIGDSKWGIEGLVKGIYIKNDVLFVQLQLENNTSIDYDIDQLRLYIRDKKRSKRTASQETEIKPLLTIGNISKIQANQINVIVFALPKFTIPDAKFVAIELMEKAGGRNLLLKINNSKIIKAISLPDYQ